MDYYHRIGTTGTNAFRGMNLTLLSRQIPLLVIAIAAANPTAAAAFEEAAAKDWRAQPAGACRGEYVQPTLPASSTNNIKASAGGILHVEDHSTTLTGGFTLEQPERVIEGEFLTLDATTQRYKAEGPVSFRERDLLVMGDDAHGSLLDTAAVIDSASFLMHQHRLRGRAEQLRREADGAVEIKEGEFTTCEPGSNTWKLEGRTIELDQAKGRGIARDVKLRIKDVPVAYIPWMRFPLDERRQSGFLVPGIGRDSEGGADLAIPYYFNLAPNVDATYTLRTIWERGVMHEGELRYLNNWSQNQFAASFLPSDDIYDPRLEIDLGNPDDIDAQDRWLGYLKHRGRLGNWVTRADYASVSDIDYFDDLDGFTNTESDLDQALNQSNAPALLREGSLTYRATQWQGGIELRSFQQLNQNQPDQYQVLPRFSLSGTKSLGPARLQGLAQFTSFDNNDSNFVTGERSVIDAGVSLPWRNAWGFVTPSLRMYHRRYSLDSNIALIDENPSLTTQSAALDTGLFFERPVNLGNQNMTQTLEPRIHYLYVEEEFQEDLPVFDTTLVTPSFDTLFRERRYTGYDRVGDANRFALGVTSRLIDSRGRERVSASIGQLFHLEDRSVNQGLTAGADPTADQSPLFLSFSLANGGLSGYANYEFDTSESRSNRSYVSVRYETAERRLINLSYSMTNTLVQRNALIRDEEETDISFVWPVSTDWQVIGRWNYGWDSGQTIESLLGLEYNDCCWRARVLFRRNLDEPRFITLTAPGSPPELLVDRRADSGIYFEFQLKGIGSLGGRLDAMLSDAIPGYTGDR